MGVADALTARQRRAQAGLALTDIDGIAYTEGPGLAGALLVGASIAHGLGVALDRPVVGIHHLEGHLLSPFLSADPPEFPFVALLVSGGHTQLMRVDGVGRYELLGETIDDAAGEAFDKSAKLLGLGYPGGPALSKLAQQGDPAAYKLPRPLLHSGDLDFSFAGLKTAVLTQVKRLAQAHPDGPATSHLADPLTPQQKADVAASAQAAIVDVLVKKSQAALKQTGLTRLVVAGGVGANRRLRDLLDAQAQERAQCVGLVLALNDQVERGLAPEHDPQAAIAAAAAKAHASEAAVAALRTSVEGFGSPELFARNAVLSRVAPTLGEIFASDASEFGRLFSTLLLPSPESVPAAAAKTPAAGK